MDYKRLDEICNIIMGQSPDSDSYNEIGEGIPFFQGNADFGEIYPTTRMWCRRPTKIVDKNTLLISVRAPIGALNFSNEKSCIGRGLAGITSNEGVCLKYIYYCMKSKYNELNSKGTGSTFKAISKTALAETKIKVIPLSEQKRRVQVLDGANNIICKRKNQLQQLDVLVKSRFAEMFGDISREEYKYKTRKLGDVANVGSSHRVFTNEFVEHGIPFYRGTEIGELANHQTPANPYYISKEHYARLISNGTKPEIGDLLLPSICNKGQVWMVDTDAPFYYKDGRVLCVSADREIYNTRYLQYYMKIKTEIEYPKLGSGSTFAEFKLFLLKDFDILTPPQSVQDQFSDFVEKTDKLKVTIQKSLEQTQLLFDSLMQEYFG